MKRHALSVVAALLFIGTIGVAVAEAGQRDVWSYRENGGGYFEHAGNGRWFEVTEHNGHVLRFVEKRRCGSYVEIYDASRRLWVRIYDRKCTVRYPGSCGYRPLYRGCWIQ